MSGRIQIRGEALRQALAEAVDILSRLGLEPGDYWMGGGTVLASRWWHRDSFDLDLFLRPERFLRALGETGGQDAVMRILQRAGVQEPRVDGQFLSWRIPDSEDGSVSLVKEGDLPLERLSDQREARHGIPLERSATILLKKIGFRMNMQDTYYDRDAYDFVAAARHAPAALQEAVGLFGPVALRDIAMQIRAKIEENPGWPKKSRPGNRKLSGMDDPDMKEHRLWQEFILLLEKGAEVYIRRTTEAPGRQGEAEDGAEDDET